MDHRSFDDLTRVFGRGGSRRGVLRAAIAAMGALFATEAGVSQVAAGEYRPVPLKQPKAFKALQGPSKSRTPCGAGYCTSEQTCNSTGTGCVPRGGIECGGGYCVANEQTCLDGRGCLPAFSTACGNGRCQQGDYCLDGRAICVDDCPDLRECEGVCCQEGTYCPGGRGTCVAPGPVCEPACTGGADCTESGCACPDGTSCPSGCECLVTVDSGTICGLVFSTYSSQLCNRDVECPGGYCTVSLRGDQGLRGFCSYLDLPCGVSV